MTPNEYQKEALRTASGMSKEYPRILNGLMVVFLFRSSRGRTKRCSVT